MEAEIEVMEGFVEEEFSERAGRSCSMDGGGVGVDDDIVDDEDMDIEVVDNAGVLGGVDIGGVDIGGVGGMKIEL